MCITAVVTRGNSTIYVKNPEQGSIIYTVSLLNPVQGSKICSVLSTGFTRGYAH